MADMAAEMDDKQEPRVYLFFKGGAFIGGIGRNLPGFSNRCASQLRSNTGNVDTGIRRYDDKRRFYLRRIGFGNLPALHAGKKQYGINHRLPWLCVIQRNTGIRDKKI